MEKATIVTLGGEDTSPVTLDISSYEEAFGEYSNVFGKRARARRSERRKRRQQRKLERISRRQERRALRRKGRREAMEERQLKRTRRRQLRLERRNLGKEDEGFEDDEMDESGSPTSENGGGYEPETTQGGGGYAPEDESTNGGGYSGGATGGGGYSGGGESGGGYSGGGYSGGGSGGGTIDYGQAGEEWGGAPPNFGEEDGYEGNVYSNDNEGTGSPEGTGSESDFEGSMDDNYGEFAGGIKVSSKIAEITKKIEWNKELVSRLRVKRAEILGLNGDTSDIDNQISSRIARISELEGMLNRYSNFSDEFSYATDEELSDVDFIDGDSFSYANGTPKGLAKGMAIRKPTPRMVGRRKAEVKRAKIMAKRRRMNAVTQVQSNLNPQISPNQIVIPPSMGGTVGDVTDKNKTFKVTSTVAIKLKYNANSQQLNPVGGGANGFYFRDTIVKGEPMKLVVRSGNNVIQYPVVKVEGTSHYVKQSDVTEISNMDGMEIDPEMMDFDAPAPRVVELSSSFDGGSKTDFTTLALGIGLGVLGVWAIGRLKTK